MPAPELADLVAPTLPSAVLPGGGRAVPTTEERAPGECAGR